MQDRDKSHAFMERAKDAAIEPTKALNFFREKRF
jgi:hypothetical protein